MITPEVEAACDQVVKWVGDHPDLMAMFIEISEMTAEPLLTEEGLTLRQTIAQLPREISGPIFTRLPIEDLTPTRKDG